MQPLRGARGTSIQCIGLKIIFFFVNFSLILHYYELGLTVTANTPTCLLN